MEERVGKLWHRLISRAARAGYPAAAVHLDEVRIAAGVMFRALGGDGGLAVEGATPERHGARRNLLQWFAGTGQRSERCSRDGERLRLPPLIDHFPERVLNRDLYLWLAALAARGAVSADGWFVANQALARGVLEHYPGMAGRYRRLLAAHLEERPHPDRLPADEAAQERAIRQALDAPGSVDHLPPARRPHLGVPLWLYPSPHRPAPAPAAENDQEQPAEQGQSRQARGVRRRKAERVAMPDGNDGLVFNRMETILSWAEYIRVNRATEEDEDPDAASAAQDLDVLSVARDNKSTAARLRFDLDLPPAESDDTPLGDGILHPEWDWRKQRYRPGYCRIQPMIAVDAVVSELPLHLQKSARRVRAQFEFLQPTRIWRNAQPEGSELDLGACLDHAADRLRGHLDAERGLYRDMRNDARDMACLLLADLSLSTDAWVSNDARVIDVIRDSLFLFAEALEAVGDRFGIYGFSSRRRDYVRFHVIKDFNECYNAQVRGRLQVIRPGYYTRMGAALRQAITILTEQRATQRLLLILTDGKPNDLDQYEGRYGIEDTRKAVHEARQAGLQPFCVTVDELAGDYLPHLFGSGGYVVIRRAADLPRELPLLYARLTG
ncbi:MAG: VWA domain-containing protein [Proteobacteria bacterium]|nr:MAG: VWA domain-containing protein [Pseudomonadota bacterium]